MSEPLRLEHAMLLAGGGQNTAYEASERDFRVVFCGNSPDDGAGVEGGRSKWRCGLA